MSLWQNPKVYVKTLSSNLWLHFEITISFNLYEKINYGIL